MNTATAMYAASLVALFARLTWADTNAPTSPTSSPDNCVTFTTVSGVTYSNCTVRRVEPDGINVFYSKGIAKIPFTELPESYREKYGYDAEKAATYRQAVAKKQAETWARQQDSLRRQQQEAQKQSVAETKAVAPQYAGEFDIGQAKQDIAKINGKVVLLKFKSMANVLETGDGYEATMFNSLFRSADSIGISATFPGPAAGWLSSCPKTAFRREGNISVGDMYESKYAQDKWYTVYGVIDGTGALRLKPLGTKKTGNSYSW